MVEEVQRVHVAHAVSDEDHRTAVLMRHLLNHLLQVQEVLLVLVCNDEAPNHRFVFALLTLIIEWLSLIVHDFIWKCTSLY